MHHAQLYIGEAEDMLSQIDARERKAGPDVFYQTEKRFGIKQARDLKEMASRTSVEGEYRTFIIITSSITTEAQNALLKLFEEPPQTARFHLIVPREDVLIPTLRSRLLRTHDDVADTENDMARTFLQSPYRTRLETITARMKEKDDDWAEHVLNGSEVFFSKKGNYDALREIAFVKKYFYGPGASKKMLLEHLALSLSVTE